MKASDSLARVTIGRNGRSLLGGIDTLTPECQKLWFDIYNRLETCWGRSLTKGLSACPLKSCVEAHHRCSTLGRDGGVNLHTFPIGLFAAIIKIVDAHGTQKQS